MKRMLALLFAVLMPTSCAYADETAEITYQGIPWGSSVETVTKWAKDQGFKFINDYSGILDYLDAEGKYTSKYMAGVKDIIADRTPGFDFQVAGYDVDKIYFCFDTVNGKDALATVTVYLDVVDFDFKNRALDDLEQKLIMVYGENECEPAQQMSGFIGFGFNFSSGDRYIKLGANNTAVCLTSESLNVMIVYGKTDAFADLKQPVATASPFNISGL